MWKQICRLQWVNRSLTLFILAGIALGMSACHAITAPPPPSQSEDVIQPITDLLQQAFNALPDSMATQDFTAFQQYFATPEQGADENGINEIYTWIQDLRATGNAPAATAEYKLNELHITNVQARANDATAHIALEMAKFVDGDNPNAAIKVEENIALVQVNGHWLISGADKAKVTNQLKAPQ